MFANHIKVGQVIQVKTKGGDPPYKAPSLLFTGEFVEERGENYKEGYIDLSYSGKVAVQDSSGKVLSFEKGLKILSIPRAIIDTVEMCRRKKLML